jgi:iron(II)-dependent oxidoreductase
MTVTHRAIADELERSRRRTLGLVDDLEDEDLRAQHSPLMSPLVWDLAHVGNYEELWLLREIDGRPAIDSQLDWLYNAFEHPRWTRPGLPILSPTDARSYLADVRGQVLDLLGKVDLDADSRLVHDGFVYGMVLQHEHQHDETMLATRQLMGHGAPPVPLLPTPAASPQHRPAAQGTVGTDEAWAYDNERPAHAVDAVAVSLDPMPVTVREYLAFVEAGAYEDERLWHPDGWAFVREERIGHPQFWEPDGDGAWRLMRFGKVTDLADHFDEPVQHVCWFEADAFARWAGQRLPTETEWELAAWGTNEWDPAATLGQRTDGPVPAHTQPVAASGALGMLGNVWEWTASDFTPYPGFESFPYDEYSAVFFGPEYKVLKGGSWATDPLAVRPSFRNWDHPIRRQIFAGFRLVQDG